MSEHPSDPPLEPFIDSARWYETGPGPIKSDADNATLIIRIGLASNALRAHTQAGVHARRTKYTAARNSNVLCSLVSAAAVTHEALRLAREEMATLRKWALEANAPASVLERVGQLCAGKHPSSAILSRARNKLGFHWDKDVVRSSVLEYGRNEKLVWVESEIGFQTVHRLAFEVLAHALLPLEGSESKDSPGGRAVQEALGSVDEAMRVITEFFTAATVGYLISCGAERRVSAAKRAVLRRRRGRSAKRVR